MQPLFPDCDYEHWLIVMDKPGGETVTKQQMIDCYVHTLAKVLDSEEEAKKKIYNVSCERYFGFGCATDEEASNKLEGLPDVIFVLLDSYVDVENKDYGGLDHARKVFVEMPRRGLGLANQKFTMELVGPESGNAPKCYSMDMSKDLVPMSVFSESLQGFM